MANKKKNAEGASDSKAQLGSFLKKYKDSHTNFEDEIFFRVSSGSLILDSETDGGISPGIMRASGETEAGKSSCILSYVKNFLETIPNSKAVYVKAEGRLGPNMKERSGVTFTRDFESWDVGSCFVFETNVFEMAGGLLSDLIMNNPNKHRYFFIFDSMDGLVPKGDMEKDLTEAIKVMGGALLSSVMLRKINLRLGISGHILAMVSQKRLAPKMSKWEKTDHKISESSGGKAQEHYPDIAFQFQRPHSQDDVIWEGEKGKSERLGHWCKVEFCKTPNEKTGKVVKYPVKYGRTGGKSVWVEYEVYDLMLGWQWMTRDKAIHSFDEDFIAECKKDGVEIPKSIRGRDNTLSWLEENPEIVQYLADKLRKLIQQ